MPKNDILDTESTSRSLIALATQESALILLPALPTERREIPLRSLEILSEGGASNQI